MTLSKRQSEIWNHVTTARPDIRRESELGFNPSCTVIDNFFPDSFSDEEVDDCLEEMGFDPLPKTR